MGVCVSVCVGHNKKHRQRRKGNERRQGKRDGKKWAKGWPGLNSPHLTLPNLVLPALPCLCLANVKFVESWPNRFDGKDGRAQLAGDAGTSPVHPPS